MFPFWIPGAIYLQCGDWTPATVSNSAAALVKGCSETAKVPEASSAFPLSSSHVLVVRQVPWLPSADGMEHCLLLCQWVQVTKPELAPAARAGKQTLIQSCAMLPDDSLNSLFIPLGTQKGAREHISTLQTQFPHA